MTFVEFLYSMGNLAIVVFLMLAIPKLIGLYIWIFIEALCGAEDD